MKKLRFIVVMCLLTCLVCGCNIEQGVNDAIDGANGITNEGSRTKIDVYNDAKDIIRQNLQSPSSAVFPTYDSDGVNVVAKYDSPDTYVTGYVDADNAFGANVRINYVVHIVYEEYAGVGNYKYEIQNCGSSE